VFVTFVGMAYDKRLVAKLDPLRPSVPYLTDFS
jgi:hypothetical protein